MYNDAHLLILLMDKGLQFYKLQNLWLHLCQFIYKQAPADTIKHSCSRAQLHQHACSRYKYRDKVLRASATPWMSECNSICRVI